MGQRTSYTPGTFSWVELATPDQTAAKRFYAGLFGWEYTDHPVGDDAVYSMAALDGRWVGALSPPPRRQRGYGPAARWHSYITVDSADATLSRARELGGHAPGGAFDVFDSGRMGAIEDPQGAVVMVWEPRHHIGAGLVNAPGALSWNELATPDVAESVRFYSELFEWTTEPFEGMGTPYVTVRNRAGHGNGGIRPAARTEPAYWMVYFGSADLEASLSHLRELGGSALMDEPIEMPMGRLAAAQDPQGAVFALYEGRFEE